MKVEIERDVSHLQKKMLQSSAALSFAAYSATAFLCLEL